MPTATIQYRDYKFSLTGCPNFGRQVKYESDVPNTPPTRANVTYTIKHLFLEEGFAENQARYQALRAALAQTEGVLFIADENGTELVNQVVRVDAMDLPVQWGQHMAEVTVSFLAYENFTGSAIDATYTPAGAAAIVLPVVTGWKESIRNDRFSTFKANRRESLGSVTASGRFRPDASLDAAARRDALQAMENTIKTAANSKDGRLIYGAFSQVVRVDTLDADLRDGTDYLDWSISCSYQRFPSEDVAEADFTVSAKDNLQTRERITSVRGTVRSSTRALALAKAETIIAGFASGRAMLTKDLDDKQVDGTDGADWLELSFSADFRETLATAATSWKLTITDKDDLKTGQLLTTYAGSVVAQTAGDAITKARLLGDGKYPIRQSATESIATASVSGVDNFAEVTFSYDYLRKGAKTYAEVSGEVDNQTFGSNSITASGFVVAPTAAAALAVARTFKPDGLLRTEKETTSTLDAGTADELNNRVEFSYVVHAGKTSGSIQYQSRRAVDYKAGEISLGYSGTAWAVDSDAADALISALVSGVTGRVTVDERTSSFDKVTDDIFISRSFNISWVAVLGAGFFGDDGIVEATYSLETTFSVNKAVITPIPFGSPYVQENTGMTPGLKVATGSLTATSEDIARTWARSKVPAGGYSDPARERVEEIYVAGSHTTVKYIKLDFTYTKQFATIDF